MHNLCSPKVHRSVNEAFGENAIKNKAPFVRARSCVSPTYLPAGFLGGGEGCAGLFPVGLAGEEEDRGFPGGLRSGLRGPAALRMDFLFFITIVPPMFIVGKRHGTVHAAYPLAGMFSKFNPMNRAVQETAAI